MGQHSASRRESKEIPRLTGLRGLAAAIVLVSHSANLGFITPVFSQGFGQVGVMIFFVLSGFLMTYLYLGRQPSKENLLSYARARIGRVVPLYLAIVLTSVIVSNFVYADFRYSMPLDDPGQIVLALFFVQAPWELWTIPVEMQFYAVFIVAWILHPRFGKRVVVLVAIVTSVPALVYLGLFGIKPSILPTYGFAFFFGALTAVFLPQIREHLSRRLPNFVGAVFLALLFINLPELRDRFGLSVAPGAGYISTWLDPITWLIVFGLFVSCVLASPSLRLLDSRPFVFLGNISYGLYLVHYPILMLVERFVGRSPIGLLLAVGGALGLAWLSYRFFERPAMALIRGTSHPKGVSTGDAAAA